MDGVFVVFMHRIPYNKMYSYKVVISFKGVKYDGIIRREVSAR